MPADNLSTVPNEKRKKVNEVSTIDVRYFGVAPQALSNPSKLCAK